MGRAQPKKWNMGLRHIKWRVWKKLIEFYVDGIEIGDNPIGGWHARCEKKKNVIETRCWLQKPPFGIFSKPSFYMAEPSISIFRCPPYRNLTTPYEPKMGPQNMVCEDTTTSGLYNTVHMELPSFYMAEPHIFQLDSAVQPLRRGVSLCDGYKLDAAIWEMFFRQFLGPFEPLTVAIPGPGDQQKSNSL